MTARRDGAGHYFDEKPEAPSAPVLVDVWLPDGDVILETDRAVFSGGRLDAGTRVLLELAPPPPSTGELLDLGAGWGPIAVSLARRAPGTRVWAVDVNTRALDLIARNAVRAGTPNISPARPDDVPAEITFDAIYSNPPVRIGKSALHGLLGRWLARLDAGAHAWLVVHKHLGSDSLARWLSEQGFGVERRGSRQGYRVLDVTR